jgi:hypothetical protein
MVASVTNGLSKNFKNSKTYIMTIQWKAVEQQFLMVLTKGWMEVINLLKFSQNDPSLQ